ncbi:hypothetical protein PILCRDRAFT_817821 [Piloderma croceum F 1598]|uniref:Uncharacterized protein n=1 Tax=Piloderma croceum (strain F 1598) TaxID=765440 RepID=A0A0C3G2U6_PILCF|nr:hypothetical protein PILCRDRAFT_817821 [Piloderma croceum F 1598]
MQDSNRARLSVYPHLTRATGTTNIWLVIGPKRDDALKNSGGTVRPVPSGLQFTFFLPTHVY